MEQPLLERKELPNAAIKPVDTTEDELQHINDI